MAAEVSIVSVEVMPGDRIKVVLSDGRNIKATLDQLLNLELRMQYLRVRDENGNKQDYSAQFVPRIGERIVLSYGVGGQPVVPHYLRVKDVAYHLDNPVDVQATILTEEETDPEMWPD